MSAEWPILVPAFHAERGRTALVVVDVQGFTTRADVGWGPVLSHRYPALAEHYLPRVASIVIPNIRQLMDTMRADGCGVVLLTVGSQRADRRDGLGSRAAVARPGEVPPLPVVGTPEHAIPFELGCRPEDIVLNKVTRSGFASTGLDRVLRNLGADTIAVCGVLTDSCVESTARDATDLGYRTIVVDDATASFEAAAHEASLAAFARLFGRVAGTNRIVAELRRTGG